MPSWIVLKAPTSSPKIILPHDAPRLSDAVTSFGRIRPPTTSVANDLASVAVSLRYVSPNSHRSALSESR